MATDKGSVSDVQAACNQVSTTVPLSPEQAAIVCSDFAKIAGGADANIAPEQLSALLAAHISREPTVEEVNAMLTALELDGNDLSLTAWLKYLEPPAPAHPEHCAESAWCNKVAWDPPPTFDFDDRPHPPAPDYADLANWLAHPDKDSIANVIVPDGEAPTPMEERPADCFYVPATTYCPGKGIQSWNAAVPDPVTDEWASLDSMNASALNQRCRIFSPRYRQSCSAPFLGGVQASTPEQVKRSCQAALDLAYTDVERAFEQFLALTGSRPIVIGGHSQGSLMAARLMEKFEQSPTLRDRLVCAYILGPVGCLPAERYERCFPSLHPCNGPLDSQCIVAFDQAPAEHPSLVAMEQALEQGKLAHEPGVECKGFTRTMDPDPWHVVRYTSGWESTFGQSYVCTNPLTWKTELGRADASLYLGRAELVAVNKDGVDDMMEIYMNMVNNQECQGLQVTRLRKLDEGAMWVEVACDGRVVKQSGEGVHEEWLRYYFNIRQNATERIEAFVSSK